ncbi:LOW QUALITY PROTEIN: lysosomal alpha-mannosidase-like [Paramacrobiotus metropolitanus]|uniref:LOW QUALITY PROTEIN: lysosomal alpha-mannosidase-like n=1 Tax=Paramacrobiotus metropolitanus TaxID=2943436 RepID=UPI002445CF42|nr:LOW QUALITY PROTEIN: lysosomal alpha-mannosidase-like [Paramacrobiotus metropolitanus]
MMVVLVLQPFRSAFTRIAGNNNNIKYTSNFTMHSLLQVLLCFIFWSVCHGKPYDGKKEFHDGEKCGYEFCPKGKPNMLNVHIVSHTHNDLGWLKTVDQYYYGAKSSVQIAGVQYILDSVVEALLADRRRRFIYVETGFFWRWWLQQDDQMHHTVHRLVNEGRLEFISGGWSMNDEAACHYASIVENFAWGLRKLNDTFSSCGRPKIGWQIDPFGHSREHASISAKMGFDGLFLGRIDYQDKEKRQLTKTMEHIWEANPALGSDADIFTAILPNVYYPPPSFCFDLLCSDPPIMDDPRLEDYNLDERVSTFMKLINEQAQNFSTNHLIVTMGNDFNYQQAHVWFKNLDKLIKYINEKQNNGSNMNLFYSTPSCYLYALNQANVTWTTKADDFFPYASGNHTYWTGYFTSRPALKEWKRESSAFLQTCKQIDALAQLGPEDQKDVNILREALGVAQHHDAVTGTARQDVTDDYAVQLHRGIVECHEVVKAGINKLSNTSADYKFCTLLNISQCKHTEKFTEIQILVWNPIGRTRNAQIHLPVEDATYKISGAGGVDIPYQITPLSKDVLSIPGRNTTATHEISFRARLPPIGYSTCLIQKLAKKEKDEARRAEVFAKRAKRSAVDDRDFTIQNDFISLTFDQVTGSLKSLTNLETQTTLAINQTFGYYEGSVGNNTKEDWRATGAYISRPNCATGKKNQNSGDDASSCLRLLTGNETYEIVKGPYVQEVRQYINTWVSQTVRLLSGSRHVDFEWQVGPIPLSDGIGKEVVSRFETSLSSKGTFYTDSNGRQTIKRTRNFRPTFELSNTEPIASNYYPVVNSIFLEDEEQGNRLTVLTDRPQGGSSLKDGQLELMVHRRLLVDDWLGVTEPLNETGMGEGLVVRGRHHLIFTKSAKSARRHRMLVHDHYAAPSILFNTVSDKQEKQSSYSAVSVSLPDNIHLLSLEQWKGSSLLIRLEHIFEPDEDPVLSQPATVDLQNIVRDMKITAVQEMTIDGNIPLDSVHRLNWNKVDERQPKVPEVGNFEKTDASTTVTLKAMEIRTFQLQVQTAN